MSRLAATRNELLAQLGPRGWYEEHVTNPSNECWCVFDQPDRRCDVGTSLFRLAIAETAVALVHPACGNPFCPNHHAGKKKP